MNHRPKITPIPLRGGSGSVPTGAMQFLDDWPGLWLRGDSAVTLVPSIRYLQEKLADHPDIVVGSALWHLGRIADIIDRDVQVRKEDLMESTDPKFVEVYRARNAPEAHLMRNALEEAGIRVQIEGELLQGGVGDLPPGWLTAPRILVEESQLGTARRIIEDLENKGGTTSDDPDEEEQTRCLACGTVMETDEVKCPSCGWSYQGKEGS